MKKALLIFVMIFLGLSGMGQASDSWKTARAFLSAYKSEVRNSIQLREMGLKIQQLKDTMDRVRVAYLWVTNNIRYDCEGMKAKNSRWALDSVLKNRKAVCAGYVNVFRNLCTAAGVVCEDISGFGRSGYEDLELKLDTVKTNHTWNAYRDQGKWYLVDITWASGFTDDSCREFKANRNDWYFNTDPVKFRWDHYPIEPNWQLTADTLAWTVFKQLPLLNELITETTVEEFYPSRILLQKKIGDTVQFKVRSKEYYPFVKFSSRKNPDLNETVVPFQKDDWYTVTYRIRKEGNYDLQVDFVPQRIIPTGAGRTYVTYPDLIYKVEARGE
ncbi:MAG: hypothetical protein K2P88_16265 [Chitinophagaceae bacterium]|nr:hypothetical protein [Chitinophagaceae bacterium]